MPAVTRRGFVQSAAAASAAFPLFTISGTKAAGNVIGANETIRIGVAGIRSRGQAHISGFSGQKNVEVACLIDPDSRLLARGHGRAKTVQDVRHALDDKDLDAISIATPNHWHSLMGIWACQAGKDVYVEKPLSHNVWEGRKLVEAARKYNRVVQHGTQQRSSQSRADEIAAVQSGDYGKLLVSKGYCCKPRWSIGFKEQEPAPAELDFDIWLGPASQQPYHENLVHYNWHWFWDTGNGDTGNQGVHEMDVARWAISGATLPTKVWSLGGRFGYNDQGQTPNMQLSVFEYGDVLLVFETRGLVEKPKDTKFRRKVANEYYTTEGMIRDGKFYPGDGSRPQGIGGGTPRRVTPGGPFGSFIAAMRSRKPQDCNADVEVGHYSAALCHLGNISYRLGKQLPFQQKARTLGDNSQVVESFETIKANCAAVDVNLTETNYQLGRVLAFDPQAEQFVGDDEADAMLTRNYRQPFAVPEQV